MLFNHDALPHESDHERAVRCRLAEMLAKTPIPPEELVDNLAIYMRRQTLTDLLSLDALYRMILDVPGIIAELGVHRGRHLSALTALRGIYETYKPHRRIVGFDTFTGFPNVSYHDATDGGATKGKFSLPSDYTDHLRNVLNIQESNEHLRHIQRTLVVEGDVRVTLPQYLTENPQTIFALVYFDLDLYEPTRDMIEILRPYLTRGSVLAFDEVGHAKWPGETLALREVLGTNVHTLFTLPGRSTPVCLRWGV